MRIPELAGIAGGIAMISLASVPASHLLDTQAGAGRLSAVAEPQSKRAPRPDCSGFSTTANCAVGFAAAAGHIMGAALACGAPRHRMDAFAERIAAALAAVVDDGTERQLAVISLRTAGAAAIDQRASGGAPMSCAAVIENLADAERAMLPE